MRLGIIGCGNMGSALAAGILSKKILPFRSIYASDKDPHRTKALYKKFGINITTNEDIAQKTDFIIIAVKPEDARELFGSISGGLTASQHIISIMAGVTISTLERLIKTELPITRAMPNMAALVGKSITCVSHNRYVKNKEVPRLIFSSVGDVIELEETKMDAVTAVSGSGPAYFFYLVEVLSNAAVKLGISKDKAIKLAISTLIGSSSLIEATNLAPEVLRKRITSKRGTTQAALKVLDRKKFKNIVIDAVKAAAKRSKELSSGYGYKGK